MIRSHSNFLFWISIGLLCISLRAAAQNQGYRTELSDGTSGWITLVNTSSKSIEAFHSIGSCHINNEGEGVESNYDAMQNPLPATPLHPTVKSLHPPLVWGQRGGEFLQDDIILPGEHWYGSDLHALPSGCIWHADIDAVLYADGTYGGDENSARALQAYRDGLAVSVGYWAERLRAEGTNIPALQALAADPEHMAARDKTQIMFPKCHEQPISCAYWNGRMQADRSFSNRWNLELRKDNDPQAAFHRTIGWIEDWRAKIEADVALHKLDETFPLPHNLAELPQPPNLNPTAR